MLLRASRRKLQSNVAFQALLNSERLQLPFLCPALHKPITHSRATSSQRPPLDTKRTSSRSSFRQKPDINLAASRGLASAAVAEYEPFQEDYIPWEGPPHLQYEKPPHLGPEAIPTPRGFDLNPSPLVLDDTPVTAPDKFRSVDAISGDLNEIHQTLHACLQVGRLERAAALVRRLNQIYKPDAPGLLVAHKDYLREVTLRIIRTKDMKLLQDLLSWFEVEMRRKGIPQDASTFALVIQASLQDPNQKRSARTIRRYYNLAREAGVEDETRVLVPEMEKVLQDMSWYFECKSPNAVDDSSKEGSMTTMSPVPTIRGVEIKGFGLSTLRKSLSMFDKHNPAGTEQPEPTLSDVQRQQILEQNTVKAAIERWRTEEAHLKSLGINSALAGSSLGSIMWGWHEKLRCMITEEQHKANEAEIKEARSKEDNERLQLLPYLQSLSAEKISAITILACMKVVPTESTDERGVKVLAVLQSIGKWIHEETYVERAKTEGRFSVWRNLSRYQNLMKTRGGSKSIPLASFSKDVKEGNETQLYNMMQWPEAIKIRIGAMLFSLIMDIAQIEVSRQDPKTGQELREKQPVFFHTYQYQAGKRVGVIRLNSAMLEKLSKAPVGSALAKHLPMVAQPKPWVGFRDGGFLEHAISVVRYHGGDSHAKRYAMTAAENGDMAQVFAGLDVLAKTPWKINRSVFDIMAQAWNTGEAIAKIPPEKVVTDFPSEPESSEDPRDRKRWLKKIQEIENANSGLRSQRCFINFQMEVARAFVGETFYFPHNVDFRGRAYPMVPFLNHMGADNARGLLMFAKGRELGSTGLWWLKVHLANVYGYDKASFEERQRFTEDHMSDISDSAISPLTGRRWWLKAEDPWQCLATCLELHAALELPDPTRYISHLAVHQDGTCNGLQHYAALGGDVVGAKQVNLEPGDRPSDIYTAVAEIIKAEVREEAARGHELASQLDGHLTRKVVKQTVMTNVYGVTFIGAKRQVRKQLETLLPNFPDNPTVNMNSASGYIARKIFSTLGTMFNGAHDIQYWLGECAGRICQSISPSQIGALEHEYTGSEVPSPFKLKPNKREDKTTILTSFITPVIWTTPLNMPVVQPYRKESMQRVQTNLQTLNLHKQSSNHSVDKARQLQGFPPNFIHSLDGTHMFLTALRCHDLGLTFASVHDSFWTHAADVDAMNKVIRDAFIRMHSEDIVARLAAEFQARYKGHMYKASVKFHSQVGRRIRDWRHEHKRGFQHGKQAPRALAKELLLETRRLRLLASEDPREMEEGRSMVTPGSIYAEMAGEQELALPSEEQPTTLGQMSARKAKLKANEKIEIGHLANEEPLEPAVVDEVAAKVAEASDVNVEEELTENEGEVVEGVTHVKKLGSRGRLEQPARRNTWVWLPLTFPPVPKKGDFDVKRLKDSPYFFS
ncbi:MAG: hypothetical protein Q9163_000950 [Psora crenata]